ncbi:arginine/serine-rich protein PNISR [Plutella xylostella]|uniref:arginine/serine-rich protein PNISR n=1 Tax=Plutella xylostella TaxID=51655 RepID=UPI002032DAF0|nr:arginine/serine-rich protein PNISR [Plutella xylostella]
MESRNNDREVRAFSRDARTAETGRRDTRRSMGRDSEIRDQRSTRLSRSDVETRRVDSRRINEREIRDSLRSMDRRQIRSNERLDLARERRAVTDRLTRSVDRTPVVRSSDSRLSSEPERIREIRRTESRSTERYDAVRDSRARESRLFTGVRAQRVDTRRAIDRRDVNTMDRLSNMPEESRRESRRTVERESRIVREERSDMHSRARLAGVRDQRLDLTRNIHQTENSREVRNIRDTRRDISREAQRTTVRQERLPSDRRDIRSEDSRRMNTRMSGNDRSIDMRRANERNMRTNTRDANRRVELANERDSIRDTRIESRRVSRSERISNPERRVDSRRENERLSRDVSRREVRTGERRDYQDMRVKREVPETRFEARNLKSLERDTVNLAGHRSSWDAVNEKGQMESRSAMNWQYLFYTLQGLYLGSVILQMIGASDKNKMRSTGFWATTQKMLKVE